MKTEKRPLSKAFRDFFESERATGISLIICTVLSLLVTNSFLGEYYLDFWRIGIGGMSLEYWVNDGLMAIFFLLIGLEIKREMKEGELSNIKTALLPIIAAFGGVVTPAFIHYYLNHGTTAQSGMGIPMATDIAFALGALSLLGKRVPASLKVFLAALAVMDDLAAILVIAIFYTDNLATHYLFAAIFVFGILFLLNKMKVMSLVPYLILGTVMWFLMLKSGVHATIAGVTLAFAIPSTGKEDDAGSPSVFLENVLHNPVAFLILPLFALANTGVILAADSFHALSGFNEIGIFVGLVVGKPIGITIFSFLAVTIGLCRLPLDLNWKHIFGAGLLGGIGFTMSFFITNLAFANNPLEVNGSKMAILGASLIAGILGFSWLKIFGAPNEADDDMETMDLDLAD